MSQFAGESFDVGRVWITPSLIDQETNNIIPLEKMSFPAMLDLESINYNRPYPFYEIRNVRNNICRNNVCENKDILSMTIQYEVGGVTKEETLQ